MIDYILIILISILYLIIGIYINIDRNKLQKKIYNLENKCYKKIDSLENRIDYLQNRIIGYLENLNRNISKKIDKKIDYEIKKIKEK